MRLSKPRLPPLPANEWTTEVRELIEHSLGGENPLNIFTTLARHPKLLKRWLVFGNHILFKSTIDARERELVILRIGFLCKSEYEWGQHAIIGKRAGLTDDEIIRITKGPNAPRWSSRDTALLRATDELHEDSFIGNRTWAALSKHYDERQLMDLVFTVGQYTLVSMALNTLGVQRDEGVDGFPD